jgi:hypothetical protein
VFAEENHEGNVLRAIRTERWKWIEANAENPRGLPERELFEVAVDPGEKENVAGREPGTAAELSRHAEGQQRAAKSAALTGPDSEGPVAGAQ